MTTDDKALSDAVARLQRIAMWFSSLAYSSRSKSERDARLADAEAIETVLGRLK